MSEESNLSTEQLQSIVKSQEESLKYYTKRIKELEKLENIQESCQIQLDLFINQMKSENNIDKLLETVEKLRKMYGNVTLGDCKQKLEALKTGYLC